MKIDRDSAQVKFPPPLMLLCALVVGGIFEQVWRLEIHELVAVRILGGSLIAFAVGVLLYCAYKFHAAKTGIKPWTTTTAIIQDGIYRFSRNPIYLSFVMIGVGIGFAAASGWILLMQVPLVLALRMFVVEKEENYLTKKFGTQYLQYKKKVRRWL